MFLGCEIILKGNENCECFMMGCDLCFLDCILTPVGWMRFGRVDGNEIALWK